MLSLIRRSPAFRLVPIWAMLVAMFVSFFVGMLLFRAAATETDIAAVLLVGASWIGVAIYLMFGKVRTRCSDFDMALPLSARQLWLGHVSGVVIAGTIIIAAVVVVVRAHAALPVRAQLEIGPWSLAAHLFAGLLLAVSLMETYRPALAQVAATRSYVWRTLGILGGVLVLLLLTASWSPLWTLVPAAAAAAIARSTYRALPEAFTMAPLEAADDGALAGPRGAYADGAAAAALTEGGLAAPSRWIVWRTAWATASCGAKDLIGFPLIAFVGVLFGGVLDLTGSESDFQFLRFTYLPLATYLLFALLPLRFARLHHVDFLPMSRRLLFAVTALPLIAALWLGYGAGFATLKLLDPREDLVTYEETRAGYRVAVPLRFTEVSWDGDPPANVAPWGESHPAASNSPLRGSGITVYSPYSVKKDSSREYVALQISRAVEAVYGAFIPPEEIAERYVGIGDDGRHRPKGAGLTLRRDYPELEPRSVGPMFPVTMAIVGLPFLLLCAALLRSYRAGLSNRVRQGIYWGSLGALLAVLILAVVVMVTRLSAPWLTRALVELPVQRMGETALGTLAAWALGLGSLVVAYLIAEAQFRRMEIPVKPPKYALIDWL